ncbi:MAG: hypothetical protein PWP27_2393 [Clostridiales bacterium]|nr:hypothetical protein [Clostridiales bacterium]
MVESSKGQFNATPVANNKLKFIFLGIIAVLIIMGSALAYKIFFDKTPKELFLEAEYKNFKTIAEKIKKAKEQERVKLAKYLLENSAHITTELSGDFSIDGVNDPQLNMIREMLKKAKIVIDTKNDSKQKKNLAEISLQLSGTNLFDVHIYQSDKKLGFKVPVLYDKYFVLDGNNLQKSLEKVDYYGEVPNKIITNEDIKNAVKLPKEQLQSIGLDYGKFILSTLKEEDFTLTKDVPFSMGDQEIKSKQITLSLPEDRLKDIMVELVSKFRDDEQLLDLIAENLYSVAHLMEEAGYATSDELGDLTDKSKIKTAIRDGALDLKDGVRDLRFPDGLKISILLDKKHNIVDRKINFVIGHQDSDMKVAFEISKKHWTNKDKSEKSNWDIKVQPRGGHLKGKNEMTFEFNASTTPDAKPDAWQKKLEAYCKLYDNDQEILNGRAEFNINSQSDKQEGEKLNTDFVIAAKGQDHSTGYEIKASGEIAQKLKGSFKDEFFDTDSDIRLKINASDGYSGNEQVTINLNLKENVKLNETLDFPELNNSNAVNLLEIDEAEKMQIMREIQNAAFKFYMKNSNLFNMY